MASLDVMLEEDAALVRSIVAHNETYETLCPREPRNDS